MDNSAMEPVVQIFRKRAPAKLLDQHRQHSRNMAYTMVESTKLLSGISSSKECLLIGCEQGQSLNNEDLIATGSSVEGASLARFFSTDNSPMTEIEFDLMISFGILGNEAFMRYVEQNAAFAHIKLHQSDFQRTIPTASLGFAASLFAYKDDGTYLSFALLKQNVINHVISCAGNSIGMRPQETESKGASIAVTIDYENDSENSIYRNEEAHQRQLYAHMKPYFDFFQNTFPYMMAQLETVQQEFADIRRENDAIPLSIQANKALEWAVLCIEIIDMIYDCRKETYCYYLKDWFRMPFDLMDDENRRQNSMMLTPYIERLTVSEKELCQEDIVVAVQQTLNEIDRSCRMQRSLWVFRKYQELYDMTANLLAWGNKVPNGYAITPALKQVGKATKESSFDLVPCMKLAFWPSVASEWRTRPRLWPEQSVVDEIVNSGVHIVGKTFCHDDIDWRLSFSVAEINLATRWSPAQHFVYFIFKALFYRFIKPLSTSDGGGDSQQQSCGGTSAAGGAKSKYLTSYIMKTVMMQTTESFEQSWWTENDAAECLFVLLLALQSAFECRTLSHYFLPSLNLLDGISDALANTVIEKVSWILRNSTEVAEQMERHLEIVETYFKAMSEQYKFGQTAKLIFRKFGSYLP